MQVETALFFESIEQIYQRVFRAIKPRTAVPSITVRFRSYANANSKIRLESGAMKVHISDLLESAPAPIQEALACILIAKLFNKTPDAQCMSQYRRYLNSAEVRTILHSVKRERGRKNYRDPQGDHYDLRGLFDELNSEYFSGLMTRPAVGWSLRSSRTTLGHYDPCHNVIVLSRLLDSDRLPRLAVRFVMFHEMLHLRYPTEHRDVRRCVHTQEFKRAERLFVDYKEARAELRRFIDRVAN